MSKEQKQQEVYEVKENEGNDNGGKGIDLNLKQAIERGIRPAVILVPLIIFATLIGIGIVDSGDRKSTRLNSSHA